MALGAEMDGPIKYEVHGKVKTTPSYHSFYFNFTIDYFSRPLAEGLHGNSHSTLWGRGHVCVGVSITESPPYFHRIGIGVPGMKELKRLH